MKNKKGFTLVELLAVVAILIVLALIITPIVDKNIKKSKEKMYLIQIENMRLVGKNYFTDNIQLRPTVDGNYYHIGINKLVEKGYIENNIKNPKTGKEFEEEIYIQIKNVKGSYVYTVCPIEDGCEEFGG